MDPLSAIAAVGAARPVERSRGSVDPRQRSESVAASGVGASTQLSQTAQLIELLLNIAQPEQDVALDALPLLAAPPDAHGVDVEKLAQALQQGLSLSGLFYESHLAEWLAGERSTEQLRGEPQGRLPPLVRALLGAVPEQNASSENAPAHDTTAATYALAALRAYSQGAASAASSPPGQTELAAMVDPRAQHLVQQQLQLLDNQQIPWQGSLWPGQPLEWTVVGPVDPDDRGRNGPAPGLWRSRLRLHLPRLGEVDAELQLSQSTCRLQLYAAASRLPQLRAALPALAQSLADAGLHAERLTVSAQDEPSHD